MKNKNLGILLIKLNNNEVYDNIISTIDQLILNNPFSHISIFNSFSDKINTGNVPILHLSHAKFFDGDMVVFDIMGLLLTKNFPNINKRYFYTQDIPWMTDTKAYYTQWKGLFEHDNLEFIVQNQELYDIYEMIWKKPIGISENFNYEKINSFI
jgi:hypothetical protein